MLKVFCNLYAQTKEDLDVVAQALEAQGFEIAYQTNTSGVVIKNVEEDAFDEQ